MFRCPHCHNPLVIAPNALKCALNHHFDQHASGYYHLMAKSRKQRMGDDDAMILARHQFLQNNPYGFLKDTLIDILKPLNSRNLVDLGCGDGYYTNAFQQALKTCDVYGFDLSKLALKLASKHSNAHYAIASIADLPLFDHQTEVVTALFVPHVFAEIKRILVTHGYLIVVSVGERHLIELKQVLYADVTLNPPITLDPDFELVEKISISKQAHLDSKTCLNLFKMTPYFHRSSASSASLFHSDLSLTMSFEFDIWVLRLRNA